ncbi:MAG: hypothetical protein OXB88_07720 [Bacteriovoracales bacterium]|nr:hypothetical protein [Bacteriovoracales bacterium]
MRFLLKPKTPIILWMISLWIEPQLTLEFFKKAHDVVKREALCE